MTTLSEFLISKNIKVTEGNISGIDSQRNEICDILKNKNYSYIMEIGFNPNSGYVYIALEDGISICSNMGQQVEFLVTWTDNGDEEFFDTYEEAQKHNESMAED